MHKCDEKVVRLFNCLRIQAWSATLYREWRAGESVDDVEG